MHPQPPSLGELAALADEARDGRPKSGLRLSGSVASFRPPVSLQPVMTSKHAAGAEESRRQAAWRQEVELALLEEAASPNEEAGHVRYWNA